MDQAMRLDPSLQSNYNGFIHPDYLEHLKPSIQGMPVQIDGVEVAGSDAYEWAKKGVLDDVNLQVAYTPHEALIVKGMGRKLAEFIRDNDEADQSLLFLCDYYGEDPDRSMDVLLGHMGNTYHLVGNIEAIASICIQDLGFTSSRELNDFLLKNLSPDERRRATFCLDCFYQHYLRDPVDIRAFGASARQTHDWVRLAVFKANVGDLWASRRALERARKCADGYFYAWQIISKHYLYLLGDWDLFWMAMDAQIASCTHTFTFLETVENLCLYVGTDEAKGKARDLMHLAELASQDADDLECVSVTWEKHFQDKKRAGECDKVARIYRGMEKPNHEDD